MDIKLEEIIFQGDRLLLNSMFVKIGATVILPLSLFSLNFSSISFFRDSFSLYNLLLDHLRRTLVSYSSLYSSTCPIRYLPWLPVSCSGWNYTVHGSSSHKCSQKSCCSAFNAVVTAFPLDIYAFLSPLYTLWSFFLTLEVPRKYVKVLGYLLNQHSSYPSSITFSDCNLWSSNWVLVWLFSSPRTYLFLLNRT